MTVPNAVPRLESLEPRLLMAATPVEAWSKAQARRYVPRGDETIQTVVAIQGDLGRWHVGDTISNFPDEYPPTPNYAEISGGKLTLRADARIENGPALNIWADVARNPLNPKFGIRFGAATKLTFEAAGFLESPEASTTTGGWRDEVALTLQNLTGETVRYVLDRHPDAQPFGSYGWRDVFLDPEAGTFTVDLAQHFQQTGGFDSTEPDSWIISGINFAVEDTGWGTLDNLRFGTGGGGGGGGGPFTAPGTVTLRTTPGKRRAVGAVRIANTGDEALTIAAISSPTNRAFRLTKPLIPQEGLELPTGAGINLLLTFRPKATTKRRTVEVIRITSTTGATQTIRLVGINTTVR